MLLAYCLIFILTINTLYSQTVYQSLTVISDPGLQYVPASIPAQLIKTIVVSSWKLCVHECLNNPLCEVFDYGNIQPNLCVLLEGSVGVLGSIQSSGVPDSLFGTIQLSPSLFTQYGQSCVSSCLESRYLICSDALICECISHMYWDSTASMCLPQMTFVGAPCDPTMNMCREDLGFQCSPMNQCSDSNSVITTTPVTVNNIIADSRTVIEGSTSVGLISPMGLAVYDTIDGQSLLVADSSRNEILLISNINSINQTASVLIDNWAGGNNLSVPSYLFLDINHQNDLYVSDSSNSRVILFTSMQVTSPSPRQVAGHTDNDTDQTDRITISQGVAVDSQQNVYVADNYNNRIMLWEQNATSGIMIIGTQIAGNSSMELNGPAGIFLDDSNSLLYVADRGNHRIQLFNLTNNPPYSGLTVAGGNGPGDGSNQLNQPSDVWVSKKTGAVYIADSSNQRIQCWMPGTQEGTTVVNGSQLATPLGLTINENETRMYVSNTGLSQIKWFDLR